MRAIDFWMAAALTAVACLPAAASEPICPYVAPDKWMPIEKAEELGRSAGLDLAYVQPDAGCWVAYGTKDGSRFEIYLHPETGDVVRAEQYPLDR